ncbi:MAG TPA: recombinase RecT [bacterium]|nr:recombinase RecT [bacterium]HQJ66269.1 recombinase RecT [bacterium]
MGVAEQLKDKMRPDGSCPAKAEPATSGKKEKSTIPVTLAGMDSHGIERILRLYEPMFANALMGAIPPERIIQISTSIIAESDSLKTCSTRSIIGAVLSASLVRLDPTPELGLVYFIPRKGKCCFEIGYQGWITLMLRNPNVSHIYAYCVREGDKFEVRLGLEPNIIHIPNLDKPGALKYVYAVAHLANGQRVFRYLNQAQVEARKDRSEAKDSKYSPWNDKVLVEEMWGKVGIKVLRKFIPVDLESRVSTANLLDGRIVTPEVFDLEKKSVKLNPMEAEDADFADVPNGNGNSDKQAAGSAANGQPAVSQDGGTGDPGKSVPDERYLKALQVHRKKIIELKGEKFWNDLPGQYGLESFEEVPNAEQERMLMDLSKITNEALRAQQQNHAGEQARIL